MAMSIRAVERGYTDRKGRQGGVKDLDETMLASIHACDICSLTGRKVDGHALVMEAVSSKMAALRNRCWQSQDANELATIAAEQRLWSRYHSLMLLHDHLATSKIFEELDPTMRYKALLDNALTSWHTDGGSPRAEGTVAAVSRALSAQFRAVTGPLFKTYQWLVNHHRPLPAPKAVTAGLAFSSHTIELILDNRPCLFQLCEESV